MDEIEKLTGFFHEVGKLKEVKRQGWVVAGIKDCESAAEHSFRFAVMSMILGRDTGIDVCKAVRMGLVHDIAEARIGDIITWKSFHMDDKSKQDKERAAMVSMTAPLGDVGKEMLSLWEEFEAGKTSEARFSREIDKLEMVFQAFEYERDRTGLNDAINTFYESDDHSAGAVKGPELRRFVERIMAMRHKLGYDAEGRYPERGAADK